MSEAKQFISSLPNHKKDCCQARLIPLVRRIEFLEKKLSEQIELREKDYNYLLRLLVKNKIQNADNKDQHPVIYIKEKKSKAENRTQKIAEIVNKKQTIKEVLNRRVSAKAISLQKDPEIILPKTDTEAKTNDSVIAIEERTKLVEQSLHHQQNELNKMKELNEYLMDQMLVIFQKIKQLDVKQQVIPKQISSLETISSMVVQGEARHQHIKIVNNLTNQKTPDLPQMELSILVSKVNEHENILSELIQLTRQVSSQISVSPKKAKQA